ncbi:MAG TPA: sialidase family protein [Myxococcales bacterium]|nr:sialidase family protein [Myxococcales bacterium]
MSRSAPARAAVLVSIAAGTLATARCSNEFASESAAERSAALRGSGPAFNVTALLRPDGASEPAISIGSDGTMAVSALSWQRFFTHVWKGPFGSTPAFQGEIDADIRSNVGGGEDADIDIGSTGALHATTLLAFFNPVLKITQLGVSAIVCPDANTANNFSACTKQIIDTTQSDRQWVSSDGARVYISYHDSGSSTTIHVQRSDDDGFTWKKVGDPVVGQGSKTGASTFNNEQGPIVADPTTHDVFAITASGTASVQKGTSADFNQIFVSRSTDFGQTWTATTVFTAPVGAALDNVFPALAVDPSNGALYAAWSDAHSVSVSQSVDHGATWSAPSTVNTGAAATAVFPWVAALNGRVDVVYYGTTSSSKNDPSAVWNVYMAQSTDAGTTFTQLQVSPHPNHVGVICTGGISCAPGTRNLLDLFEIALDPRSGKAGIIYTDDTLTTESDGSPLPQVVLAQQR